MGEAEKKDVLFGENILVIDWVSTSEGHAACICSGTVLGTEGAKCIHALVNQILFQKYHYKDLDRLLFKEDDVEKANAALNKIPKPKSTVFQIEEKSIRKRTVQCVGKAFDDGFIDIVIRFSSGEQVSIDKIGESIFTSREEALAVLQQA